MFEINSALSLPLRPSNRILLCCSQQQPESPTPAKISKHDKRMNGMLNSIYPVPPISRRKDYRLGLFLIAHSRLPILNPSIGYRRDIYRDNRSPLKHQVLKMNSSKDPSNKTASSSPCISCGTEKASTQKNHRHRRLAELPRLDRSSNIKESVGPTITTLSHVQYIQRRPK